MSTASGPIPQEKTPSNNGNNQEEIDINLEDPQVQDAAKKIQNVFRGKRFGVKKDVPSGDSAAQSQQ